MSDSSPGPAQPAQPAGLFQSGRAGEGFPAGTGPARAGLCRAPRRPASRAAGTAPLRSRYQSRSQSRSCSARLASCCSALYFSARSGTARRGPVRRGSVRFAPVLGGLGARPGEWGPPAAGPAGVGPLAEATERFVSVGVEIPPSPPRRRERPLGGPGAGRRERCPHRCPPGLAPPRAARGFPGGLPGEASFPRPPLRDPVSVPTVLLHLSFSTYVIVLVWFCFVFLSLPSFSRRSPWLRECLGYFGSPGGFLGWRLSSTRVGGMFAVAFPALCIP